MELWSDLYGEDVVYHGTVSGFSGGTGAAFALVPAPHPRANRNTVHSGGAAEIRFEDVTYAHGHGSPVLQGFTLTLAAGERVIIRAPSGGGKTTAMHLVLGLVTPQRGRVLAAGADAALTRLAVPASVAWLPQLPHLFAATVADNVRLGAPGATDDAVRDALRRVNADFVDELPFGVESLIGDRGTTLSGGQRQRIALARTMLLDCPIVLLDEPLAHLGAESRAAIGEQLEAATRGRTVLIAAHAAEPFAWADGVIDIVDASGLRATPLQAAGVPA